MNNRSFWNDRYLSLPQLGSGPGSRGYAASYKNEVVHAILRATRLKTIFDIGCGDLCWLDDQIAQSYSYVGYDISEVLIARNMIQSPSARFVVHDITTTPLDSTADLVVSFDVLIHQIEITKFTAALTNIVSAIGKVGLVSYRTPPLGNGRFAPAVSLDMSNAPPSVVAQERQFLRMVKEELPADRQKMATAFHGPLPELVQSLRLDFETRPVGQYRNQTIYEVRPRP